VTLLSNIIAIHVVGKRNGDLLHIAMATDKL
jgi:hypothetical protein